jgi:hypothetical protein
MDETTETPSVAPKISVTKEIEEFRLPLSYLEPSLLFSLNKTVSDDLELVGENAQPGMYDYLLKPSHSFSKALLPSHRKQYTTDISFLTETQTIVSKMDTYNDSMSTSKYAIDTEKITEIWGLLKKDDFFLEKYGFLEWDWEIAQKLNQSSSFLQFMSIMNIMSPALSLLLPFFMLLFPFLLLKIQRIPITFETYLDTLKHIARHHFLGKSLMGMTSMSWDKVIYFLFMIALYGLQIYQNTTACIRFYRNLKVVNETLVAMKEYCQYSARSMENYFALIQESKTYASFGKELKKHAETMQKINAEIQQVTVFSHSVNKVLEFGYMLKCFYELHKNPEYDACLRFSMGFEGYIDHVKGLHSNWKGGNLAKGVFGEIEEEIDTDNEDEDSEDEGEQEEEEKEEEKNTKDSDEDTEDSEKENLLKENREKEKKEKKEQKKEEKEKKKAEEKRTKKPNSIFLKGQYYPTLVNESHVKNNCYFGKNMILSAPNKAGKTTILKTTAINILFTQQFGYGFYESAVMCKPYTHFHSYLNIPDTSGRDSLFQAESRRCKEILDSVKENVDVQKYKHFCIFDELYSGTNPEEACSAGCAFLNYLSKFSNVDFMLTTHYTEICKHFKNSKMTQNYKMEVHVLENGSFEYSYRMLPGISEVKGAIRVLKDMDYPKEILEEIE